MPALPTQLDSFVGRDDELAEATRLLAETRLLTVVGPGGAGKTRLAMELARRIAGADLDEIWLVDLTSTGDIPLQVVAAAIGIREEPRDGLVEAVAAVLGQGPALLVLDNCEHVVAPIAELVAALLRRCPQLRVLATSQELLSVPGEVVFPLAGLIVRAEDGNRPRGAVRLFVDRARECRPDFALTPHVTSDVAQICARLDGLPLCIELAARWIRSLTAAEILSRLDDRFELLTASARTVADRHRSLRAVIEWSYHLLDATERAALCRLAVLPGGFDLDGAVAVLGRGAGTGDALHLVDRLQAKSLVVRSETARGATRFRQLESIRLYALEQLELSGEGAATRDRLVAWLAAECVPLADEVFQFEPMLSRLDEERDNLAAAYEAACAAGDDQAPVLAIGLAACWRRLGWVGRARDLIESVRARKLGGPMVVNMAAQLAADQTDYDVATTLAKAVVASEQARGASIALIRAVQTLAVVADYLGDAENAEQRLAECVRLAADLDRPLLTAMCRQNLAWGLLQAGHVTRAETLLAEVLPELRQLVPEPMMLSGILHTLGVLAIKRGDLDGAEQHLREGLTVSAGDRLGTRYALDGLAAVAAERGDATRALRLSAAVEAMEDSSAPMTEITWKHQVDAAVERCRTALGVARSAAIWDEATRATVDEIVRYALGGPWPDASVEPALSGREREVARLVADGLTNREIAGRLGLSSRTVDSHLEHIRTKLGLRSRAQVAAWAASQTAD